MSKIKDIPFQRETVDVLNELGVITTLDLLNFQVNVISWNTLRLLTDPYIKKDIEDNMTKLIMSN